MCKFNTEKFPYSLLAAFLFVGLVVLVFPRSWAVSIFDDLAIIQNVSTGFVPGFMSPGLGSFFSFLYLEISADIPWYGLFMYSVHVFVLSLLLCILSRVTRCFERRGFLVAVFFLFYLVILYQITFTSVAMLAGLSGCVVWAAWAWGFPVSYRILTAGGVALALAFLVRMEALLGVFAVSWVVLFVAGLTVLRQGRYRLWRGLFVFFSIPVLVVGFQFLSPGDAAPEQKEYEAFEKYRGEYHFLPISRIDIDKRPELLAANAWTINDAILMRNFHMNYNEKKFNVVTISNVFHYVGGESGESPFTPKFLLKKLPLFIFAVPFWVFLFLVSRNVLRCKEAGSGRWIPVAFFIYTLSLVLYMALLVRFPERISLPIHLGLAMLLFVAVSRHAVSDKGSMPFDAVLGGVQGRSLLVLVALLLLGRFGVDLVHNHTKNGQRLVILQEMRRLGSGVHLFCHGGWLPFPDPLRVYRELSDVIPHSYVVFSPRFYALLRERLGVERGEHLFQAMVDNRNAYFLAIEPLGHYHELDIGAMHHWKMVAGEEPFFSRLLSSLPVKERAHSHVLKKHVLAALEEWNGIKAAFELVSSVRLSDKDAMNWYRLIGEGVVARSPGGIASGSSPSFIDRDRD